MAKKVRVFREKLKSGKLCNFYSYDFTVNKIRFKNSTGIAVPNKTKAQTYAQDLYERIKLANTAETTLQNINRKLVKADRILLESTLTCFFKKPTKKTRSEKRKKQITAEWKDFTA